MAKRKVRLPMPVGGGTVLDEHGRLQPGKIASIAYTDSFLDGMRDTVGQVVPLHRRGKVVGEAKIVAVEREGNAVYVVAEVPYELAEEVNLGLPIVLTEFTGWN